MCPPFLTLLESFCKFSLTLCKTTFPWQQIIASDNFCINIVVCCFFFLRTFQSGISNQAQFQSKHLFLYLDVCLKTLPLLQFLQIEFSPWVVKISFFLTCELIEELCFWCINIYDQPLPDPYGVFCFNNYAMNAQKSHLVALSSPPPVAPASSHFLFPVFLAMEELDGDEVRVSSRGRLAERDIVQVLLMILC